MLNIQVLTLFDGGGDVIWHGLIGIAGKLVKKQQKLRLYSIKLWRSAILNYCVVISRSFDWSALFRRVTKISFSGVENQNSRRSEISILRSVIRALGFPASSNDCSSNRLIVPSQMLTWSFYDAECSVDFSCLPPAESVPAYNWRYLVLPATFWLLDSTR